jgi:hypothetical protein
MREDPDALAQPSLGGLRVGEREQHARQRGAVRDAMVGGESTGYRSSEAAWRRRVLGFRENRVDRLASPRRWLSQ